MSMYKTAIPAVLTVAIGLLVGCSQKAPQQDSNEQDQAQDEAPVATPPTPIAAPVQIDSRSKVANNHLLMYIADGRVLNWEGVGSRHGDELTTNATDGYLMFGPKVPFDAGNYKVTIDGSGTKVGAENSIIFDVTSDAGQKVHAKHVLEHSSIIPADGPVAEFTFTLKEAVTDLEIRAFVTSGSQITLTRYEVQAAR